MTDSKYVPTAPPSPVSLDEAAVLTASHRTNHIDHCFRLLANRRRRFCLYYLLREDMPLQIHRLAELVETSLAPPETAITERVVEDGLAKLVHSHLPTLCEAGLVQVNDRAVELVSDPALPIRDWLSMTAEVELNP